MTAFDGFLITIIGVGLTLFGLGLGYVIGNANK